MVDSVPILEPETSEIAYVMINCPVGSEQHMIEKLKSLDSVKEIQGVLGNYDILAKIEASTIDLLRDIIVLKIRNIPDVNCTTTLICAANGRVPSS